jgi:hypothetical protein
MGSETLTRVALFPLSVVLFPQGVLPLRVFEARYMDMVRDCMRDDSSFGVCLVSEGKAASANGAPATADVGCLARITAWDMQQLGLLQIRTVGGDRFRLLASELQPNGLIMGEIDLIEADEDQQIPDAHRPCVELLTRIIEDMSAQLAEKRRTGETSDDSPVLAQLPFEEPFQMDSSAWVSNRLCEVLPVPLKAKQKLMELTDGSFKVSLDDVGELESSGMIACLVTVSGSRGGKSVETRMVEIGKSNSAGQVVECWWFPEDMYAGDEFFGPAQITLPEPAASTEQAVRT